MTNTRSNINNQMVKKYQEQRLDTTMLLT